MLNNKSLRKCCVLFNLIHVFFLIPFQFTHYNLSAINLVFKIASPFHQLKQIKLQNSKSKLLKYSKTRPLLFQQSLRQQLNQLMYTVKMFINHFLTNLIKVSDIVLTNHQRVLVIPMLV
jgi:regulator of PEP synthase PpsR (kinase-PPPase family)